MGKLRLSSVIEIDSSHYLKDYCGKCANLHGHRWKIEVVMEGSPDELDKAGMVCDFGVFKEILKKYDHAVLVYEPDQEEQIRVREFLDSMGFERVIVMDKNTTAENLSVYWADEIMLEIARLGLKAKLVEIKVWETPNNSISYFPDKG